VSAPTQPSLFINLASAESSHQGKALRMASKMLGAGWPVTISLNVGAVSLVDPTQAAVADPVSGKPLQSILAALISERGRVLVGAECMTAAGLSTDALPEGMAVADIPTITALLADPGVRTLSW